MHHNSFGLGIPESLEDVCHPARMALIVYEMQVDGAVVGAVR